MSRATNRLIAAPAAVLFERCIGLCGVSGMVLTPRVPRTRRCPPAFPAFAFLDLSFSAFSLSFWAFFSSLTLAFSYFSAFSIACFAWEAAHLFAASAIFTASAAPFSAFFSAACFFFYGCLLLLLLRPLLMLQVLHACAVHRGSVHQLLPFGHLLSKC